MFYYFNVDLSTVFCQNVLFKKKFTAKIRDFCKKAIDKYFAQAYNNKCYINNGI